MRGPLVLASALLVGCYSPRVTPGAPCDPAIGNCPRPLVCVSGPIGYTCELSALPPDSAADPDAAIDAAADGAIDAAPDAMPDAMADAMPDAMADAPSVTHLEYPSVVADCVDPGDPDPDTCSTDNNNRIAVDADDTSHGNPWEGYVRFDLDGMLAGRVITSVKLRMSTPSDGSSSSSSSGVIWQVGPFTRQTLMTAVPVVVSASPIAGSQGSVSPSEDVLWPLPVSLPTANGSVYLRISTSDDDGTLYYNQTGSRPPRLIIDLQP